MLAASVSLTVAAAVVPIGQSVQFVASEVGGGGGGSFVLRDASGRVVALSPENSAGKATLVVRTDAVPNAPSLVALPSTLEPGHLNFAITYQPATGAPVTQALVGGVDVVTPRFLQVTGALVPGTTNQFTLVATRATTDPTAVVSFVDETLSGPQPLGSGQGFAGSNQVTIQATLTPGSHHIGAYLVGGVRPGKADYNILPFNPIIAAPSAAAAQIATAPAVTALIAAAPTAAVLISNQSVISQNQPVANYVFGTGAGAGVSDATGHFTGITTFGTPRYSTDIASPSDAGESLDTAHGAAVQAPLATTQLDNVTMSAWVKWTPSAGRQSILYEGSSGSDGFGLYMDAGRPTILLGGQEFLEPALTLSSSWTLLTAERTNGVWSLSINGVNEPLTGHNLLATPYAPTQGVCIGGDNNGGGERFTGLIDDPAIFNMALSSATVAALAHETPATPGQTLSYTAQVAATAPGSIPTGTTQLIVDGVATGPAVALDASGQATLTLPSLAAGWHSIATAYSGDSSHLASLSPAIAQEINPAEVSVSGTTTAIYGDSAEWTATTTPSLAGIDTVTFSEGNVVLAGGVPLNAQGQAVFAPSQLRLGVGSHLITATLQAPNGATDGSQTTSLVVSPRTLNVVVTAASRVYDQTNQAQVSFSDDRLAGDSLTLIDQSATFANAQVGTDKVVTVAGLTLTGADALNYQLAATPATVVATISPRPLPITVVAATSRPFNGTNAATVTLRYTPMRGESVQVDAQASFGSAAVGTQIATVTGVTLSGPDAANYRAELVNDQASATITPLPSPTPVPSPTLLASQTTLTITSAPGTTRQTLTFQVSVTGASGASSAPSGLVQFLVNGSKYGNPVPLVAATSALGLISTVRLATSTLAPGTYQVQAVYLGTKPFATSTSHPVGVTVVDLTVGGNRLAVDAANNVYVADPIRNQVIKVAPNGTSTVVAGTGATGATGDGGLAVAATLNQPAALTLDALGNLYIADTGNNLVRKVTPAGIITTVAGGGTLHPTANASAGVSALAVSLNQPSGLVADSAGDLFIADTLNNVVRVVSPNGTIRTVAGTGIAGLTPDGTAATASALNKPSALALDAQSDLYIADTGNNRVARVAAALTRSAGSAVGATPGAVAPLQTVLSAANTPGLGTQRPTSIALGKNNIVYTAFGTTPNLAAYNPQTNISYTITRPSDGDPAIDSGQIAARADGDLISTTSSDEATTLLTGAELLNLLFDHGPGDGFFGGSGDVGLLGTTASSVQISTELLAPGSAALGLFGTVAFTASETDAMASASAGAPNQDDPGGGGNTLATASDEDVPPSAASPQIAVADPWAAIRQIIGTDSSFSNELKARLLPPASTTTLSPETPVAPPAPGMPAPATTAQIVDHALEDYASGAIAAAESPADSSDDEVKAPAVALALLPVLITLNPQTPNRSRPRFRPSRCRAQP